MVIRTQREEIKPNPVTLGFSSCKAPIMKEKFAKGNKPGRGESAGRFFVFRWMAHNMTVLAASWAAVLRILRTMVLLLTVIFWSAVSVLEDLV